MTLEEARQFQKKEEKRILIKFLVCVVVCAIFFFLSFYFSNLLDITNAFLAFPIVALIFIISYFDIFTFFTPKEFKGKIISIYTFSTRKKIVKGAGWGNGPNVTKSFLASEIIVKNEKGKTMIKTFRNGDIVSKLKEGDEIIILRFVDQQPFID